MNPFKDMFATEKQPGREADEVRSAEPETIEGDRGVASVNRIQSIQSRMSNLLAIGLIGALGLGTLSWYYSQTWSRQKSVKEQALKASHANATGDLPLPPLGKIAPSAASTTPDDSTLGGAPPLPVPSGSVQPQLMPAPTAMAADATTRPTDRRLEGPVFEPLSRGVPNNDLGAVNTEAVGGAPAAPMGDAAGGSLFKPTVASAVRATVLANQPLLLPKGAFIDCTLETAIDSSLPGLTTCVTATDTFGADGKVVLIERGTKLVGETKGDVRQGMARIFVLWDEARTPAGVVVPLASPGTDELGRSGLSGTVDRHFMDRFGAALLISMVDGVIQAAAQPNNGGAVIYNPTAGADIVTEVLKSTVSIPPTVRKQNGDRIQILVARDIDFRSVYQLKSRE